MGYQRRGSGPPTWFVFIVGVAMIFGAYYLFLGVRNYIESGGASVLRATRQAEQQITATADRLLDLSLELPTRRPSPTDVPECQIFLVSVPSAIIRRGPSTASGIVDTLDNGAEVCVIQLEPGTDWYLIDVNPVTRRIDPGYMRQDLIEPRDPTPTPSNTVPPPPTITLTPTYTPTPTRTPSPTATDGPSPTPNQTRTETPTPTPTTTPTPDAVSI